MLNKNSEMMKTIVETFVIEETAELIYDNEKLEQWNDYINELNLEGQTKLAKPEKSPIPFMYMKTGIVRMFETLCPRKVDIEIYDVTPIPVEILGLVSMSKREHHFDQVQIWYDDSDPDPVCVGLTCQFYGYEGNYSKRTQNFVTREALIEAIGKDKSIYTTNEKHYLIGKWADVKRSFKELKQMAIERKMEGDIISIKQAIKRSEKELEEVELTAKNYFA